MHRQPDAHRHPRGRDLLQDLQVDLVGHVAAAPALGVGQPEQAGLAEQPELVPREALGLLVLGREWFQLVAGEFGRQREQVGVLAVGKQALDRHGSLRCTQNSTL